MPKKIAVITGTRAEYGLLTSTMRELQTHGVELQLIVTGAHLSADHGMTVKQIEADGWSIAAKVDMQLTSDDSLALVKSMGLAVSGIGEALSRLKPDMVVILGDRYEMLAAASAAAMLTIPIAHIHGGEVTEGAIDESIRHAITKLSYWHFPPYQKAAERIMQMGEDPARIFMCGAPGIDMIAQLPLLSREALEKELNIALISPVMLFTYHPETLSAVSVAGQINTVMEALKAFPDTALIMSGANADEGGRAINKALQDFSVGREHSLFRMSYGSLLYLSLMRVADVVVGNSSSAMIEAPAMGRATVNIGDRQTGRLRLSGIIDCCCDTNEIIDAITKALSPSFRLALKPATCYGAPGEVGKMIAEKLMALDIPVTLRKAFYSV